MKRDVAIIVDGTAAVPAVLVDELDVRVVPIHMIIDGEDRPDETVDMQWLFQRLKQRENLPTTAAPSMGEMLEAYNWAAERAKSAISIHLTSAFSKSYESGVGGRELAHEKRPDMPVEVIDSHTAEAGELAMVMETAKMALEGASFEEVVRRAYELRDTLTQYYCFDTLFYRDKGGRTFRAKAWAEAENEGGAGLKALLQVDHGTGGTVQPICRARSKRQLFRKIVQMTSERSNGARLCGAIVHINAEEEAHDLANMLKDELDFERIQVAHSCPATVIQSGEGFIACAWHRASGV